MVPPGRWGFIPHPYNLSLLATIASTIRRMIKLTWALVADRMDEWTGEDIAEGVAVLEAKVGAVVGASGMQRQAVVAYRLPQLELSAAEHPAFEHLHPTRGADGSRHRTLNRQRSGNERLRQHHYPIALDVEPEYGMAAVAALGIHQHRFPQPPSDGREEPAEQVESRLPLEFPQVDIKVDLVRRMEAEDHQHIGSRPDPHLRALSVGRTGQRCLRPRHRKYRLSFGVLVLPSAHVNKVEDSLPVLDRGPRNEHVRQHAHQIRVEEPSGVIPQQVSHSPILPGAPSPCVPGFPSPSPGAPLALSGLTRHPETPARSSHRPAPRVSTKSAHGQGTG